MRKYDFGHGGQQEWRVRMKNMVAVEMKRYNYLISEIDAAYHEAANRLGLSDSALIILYALYSSGGECLLSDICRLSGVSKQTIHSGLRKLTDGAIVELAVFQGKKKKVYLTEKGKAAAEDTVGRLIALENGIFDSWSGEEREQYLGLMQKYLDAFREGVRRLER